jgi:hypothetical protein
MKKYKIEFTEYELKAVYPIISGIEDLDHQFYLACQRVAIKMLNSYGKPISKVGDKGK